MSFIYVKAFFPVLDGDAFHAYFSNSRYFDIVKQAFGWDIRKHIEDMAGKRCKRKILKQPDAAE